MSNPMIPDRFNFAALGADTPKGWRVRECKWYLHLERQTATQNKHFILMRMGGEFHLYQWNSSFTNWPNPLENCTPDNFVMRSDDLQRMLKLLGY
jgi:hypothetical protein